MVFLAFCPRALRLALVAAILGGCGGVENVTGAMPQRVTDQDQTFVNRSNSYGSILYASEHNFVTMLTYPELKIIGRFRYPKNIELGQGCPNNATGTIYFPIAGHYVVHPGSALVEYADGGTKVIGSLNPPKGDYAVNCAVDPTTGNIAVVLGTPHLAGFVGIYARGSRRPATYKYSNLHWSASCTYDSSGNLFIEGETDKYKFLLLELPKGGSQLTKISLHAKTVTLGFPVEWDGSYITISSLSLETKVLTMDRISVSGTKATVVGTTELRGAAKDLWIQGDNTVITGRCCSTNNASYVAFYAYPAGGKPQNIFKGLRNKHGGAKPSREVIGLAVATLPSVARRK
jgi:hypothetical protein